MSLYGTLPRRPPRPVQQFPFGKLSNKFGDNLILSARQLGNYAAFRNSVSSLNVAKGNDDKESVYQNINLDKKDLPPSSIKKQKDSDGNSTTTTRRRIRWSREDLLLCTPLTPMKFASKASIMMESEEDETTLEEDNCVESDNSTLSPGDITSNSDSSDDTNRVLIDKDPPLPPRRPPRQNEKPPAPLPHNEKSSQGVVFSKVGDEDSSTSS